jgi:hypothetical protein
VKEIRFGVLLSDPVCEPLGELKGLIRTGRLPRVVSIWGTISGVGDCHLLAHAVMLDLAAAGPLRHTWHWLSADCRRNSLGWHSWNEAIAADGVAAYASDPQHRAAQSTVRSTERKN